MKHPEAAKTAFNAMVGTCVRTYRRAGAMSQVALADHIGVSASMVQNIEIGAIACPLFALRNIAEVFDCTLDDLVPVTIDEPEEV